MGPRPRPALSVLPEGWGGRRLGRQGRVRLEDLKKKKIGSISADGSREALSTHGRWTPRSDPPAEQRIGALCGCQAFGRRAGLAGPAPPPPMGMGTARHPQGLRHRTGEPQEWALRCTVPSGSGDPRMCARRACWKLAVPEIMTSFSTPESPHKSLHQYYCSLSLHTGAWYAWEPRNTSRSVNSRLASP